MGGHGALENLEATSLRVVPVKAHAVLEQRMMMFGGFICSHSRMDMDGERSGSLQT